MPSCEVERDVAVSRVRGCAPPRPPAPCLAACGLRRGGPGPGAGEAEPGLARLGASLAAARWTPVEERWYVRGAPAAQLRAIAERLGTDRGAAT